jgi:hypothetical protein
LYFGLLPEIISFSNGPINFLIRQLSANFVNNLSLAESKKDLLAVGRASGAAQPCASCIWRFGAIFEMLFLTSRLLSKCSYFHAFSNFDEVTQIYCPSIPA